jgi:hypothetical protein
MTALNRVGNSERKGIARVSSEVRFIAVDWSGATKGARRKICLAEVVNGRMTRLESGRSREEIADFLVQEAREAQN